LLVPIASAAYTADSSGGAAHAVGSTVAYALMYAAVNLGAFAVAALVARTSPANRVADYRGLSARRPLAALALAFFLLCLAGLPPGIIGLFAKVTVFSAAVDAGLGWLAVVMAVNVVIALYYYLQWTAVLFRAPEGAPAAEGAPGPVPTAAHPEGVPGAVPTSAHPEGVPAPVSAVAQEPEPAKAKIPATLTAAIGLAAVLGIALSGAPQLVLRFASGVLL
ncbi:hypothetical protein ADK38_04670, partial [Streptomyces varsoviensis]